MTKIKSASDCRTMSASEVLSALCPAGHARQDVYVEQDWDREETTIHFKDGSSVIVSGRDVQIVDSRGIYRACYAQSADGQGEVVLTGEEHSHMSDDELVEEAIAEARRAGIVDEWGGEDALRSSLRIGAWRA